MSKKQSAKSMERKPIKQRITGISKKKIVSIVVLAIVMLATISAIVYSVNNVSNIKKSFNKSEPIQALTSTADVKAIWVNTFGAATNASYTDNDTPYSIIQIKDGGYIVGGRIYAPNGIDFGNNVEIGSHSDTGTDEDDGFIAKYNSDGECMWAKVIGSTLSEEAVYSLIPTKDGGFIAAGEASYSNLGNGIPNGGGGFIIKFNSEGEAEWAKDIPSNGGCIYSVTVDNEDNVFVGGGFWHNIDLGDGVTIKWNGSGQENGVIAKYDSNGTCKWAKVIGGSNKSGNFSGADIVKSVAVEGNGNVVAVAQVFSKNIDLGNGITISKESDDNATYTIIAQYNADGEAEYARQQKGTACSVIANANGGYIVASNVRSTRSYTEEQEKFDLGNNVSVLLGYEYVTGVIAEYNEKNECQRRKYYYIKIYICGLYKSNNCY